jgi:hypothetical protein
MLPLPAYHQYRTMGVPNDTIGDAPHEGPPQTPESTAPHDDQSGAQLLAEPDDRLVFRPLHLEVRLRDGTPGHLDLPHLLVEHALGFLPDLFHSFFVRFVAETRFVRRVGRVGRPGLR